MLKAGSERIIGGLGALFIILGVIPYVGWIFSIAGIVLLLVALNKFSQIFGDKDIFSKFLKGFLISVAGIVFAVIFGLFSLIPILRHGGQRSSEEFSIIGIIIALVIAYILTVVSCSYYRQSLNILYEHTNMNLFKLSGTFLFWGAITLIVFGIGALGLIVGWILLAVAFFTLPPSYETIKVE